MAFSLEIGNLVLKVKLCLKQIFFFGLIRVLLFKNIFFKIACGLLLRLLLQTSNEFLYV